MRIHQLYGFLQNISTICPRLSMPRLKRQHFKDNLFLVLLIHFFSFIFIDLFPFDYICFLIDICFFIVSIGSAIFIIIVLLLELISVFCIIIIIIDTTLILFFIAPFSGSQDLVTVCLEHFFPRARKNCLCPSSKHLYCLHSMKPTNSPQMRSKGEPILR